METTKKLSEIEFLEYWLELHKNDPTASKKKLIELQKMINDLKTKEQQLKLFK
jgi:hypothetical protein